jgi:hypothetical protein
MSNFGSQSSLRIRHERKPTTRRMKPYDKTQLHDETPQSENKCTDNTDISFTWYNIKIVLQQIGKYLKNKCFVDEDIVKMNKYLTEFSYEYTGSLQEYQTIYIYDTENIIRKKKGQSRFISSKQNNNASNTHNTNGKTVPKLSGNIGNNFKKIIDVIKEKKDILHIFIGQKDRKFPHGLNNIITIITEFGKEYDDYLLILLIIYFNYISGKKAYYCTHDNYGWLDYFIVRNLQNNIDVRYNSKEISNFRIYCISCLSDTHERCLMGCPNKNPYPNYQNPYQQNSHPEYQSYVNSQQASQYQGYPPQGYPPQYVNPLYGGSNKKTKTNKKTVKKNRR